MIPYNLLNNLLAMNDPSRNPASEQKWIPGKGNYSRGTQEAMGFALWCAAGCSAQIYSPQTKTKPAKEKMNPESMDISNNDLNSTLDLKPVTKQSNKITLHRRRRIF